MVTFDLATSGNFEGICYGVVMHRDGKLERFVSLTADKKPMERLHPVALANLLIYLDTVTTHDTLYGWGSLAYDCRLLCKEAGNAQLAVELAHNHVDMMWLLLAHAGQYVSLAEVGAYHKVSLDPNMGRLTPELWKGPIEGMRKVAEHQRMATHVIMHAAKWWEHSGRIQWVDKKTGRDCYSEVPYMKNGGIIKNILDLPQYALSKGMQESTGWLREAVAHATPSHV